MSLSLSQLDRGRVATWILDRWRGDWVAVAPDVIAREAGVTVASVREHVAYFATRGNLALEKRGGLFCIAPTAAGFGPLRAYVTGFAAAMLLQPAAQQGSGARGK